MQAPQDGEDEPHDTAEPPADPAFFIKNLDTGLEMRIDDFDRLANIAADEHTEHDPAQPKPALIKGTKAFKHWGAAAAKRATATAKKAVSGIKDLSKDLSHEINSVPQLLAKHRALEGGGGSMRARAGASGSDAPAAAAAAAAAAASSPRSSELARMTTPEPPPGPDELDQARQPSSSAASLSASDLAATSIKAAAAGGGDATAGLHAPAAAGAAAAGAGAAATAAVAGPAGMLSAHQAAAAAAAAAAPAGPAVPAAVRLVSHKRSGKAVEEVVLAQVLEGSCGVVWALAFSRDGSFLAAGGQDGVLRVWQLTASREREQRTNWVYASSAAAAAAAAAVEPPGQIAQQALQGAPAAAAGGQPQQPPLLQQQQAAAGAGRLHLPDAAGVEQQQQRQQQQQQPPPAPLPPDPQQDQKHPQQQQQQQAAAPAVDFGPYLSRQPVREYGGHSEDILDVSWSAGGFLLSCSLDRSVRLWHLSQPGCLRKFWHSDFVTAVTFHPLDAQRFASGSIDGKLRVWSIPGCCVLATAVLHQDMVTALSFSLNGNRVIAGTMRGRVRFYELAERQLEYVAQVDVRNQRGQHASGKKVTGICPIPGKPGQFLVTTNDSRLRLLDGYGTVLKFKGHRNSSSQVRAALTADGSQVVCGSDDGWVYMWQLAALGAGASGGAAGAGGAQLPRDKQGAQRGSSAAERQRGGLAAVAASQVQLLCGKNGVFQAFAAHEQGVPVTSVACAPPSAYAARSSVLGPAAAAAAADCTAADGGCSAGTAAGGTRPVLQLLVSGGFSGSIRIHELLGPVQHP